MESSASTESERSATKEETDAEVKETIDAPFTAPVAPVKPRGFVKPNLVLEIPSDEEEYEYYDEEDDEE